MDTIQCSELQCSQVFTFKMHEITRSTKSAPKTPASCGSPRLCRPSSEVTGSYCYCIISHSQMRQDEATWKSGFGFEGRNICMAWAAAQWLTEWLDKSRLTDKSRFNWWFYQDDRLLIKINQTKTSKSGPQLDINNNLMLCLISFLFFTLFCLFIH